jgi:hypothetical protein
VHLSSVAEGGLLGSDIRGLLGCWRSDSRRAALAFGWTCQPRRCAPRTLPATRPVPWRACFPAVRDRRAAQRPDPARPGPGTRSVPGSEAPPVAPWWVPMDGDGVGGGGTSPVPCVDASFCPKVSLGQSGRSGRVARVHTRNPTVSLRGCRRCKPAKCRNKTGRNRDSAWSRLTSTHHRTQENELHPLHRAPRGCFT